MKFATMVGVSFAVLSAGALALASQAEAATITFETAPFGGGFTGPVTESGFTYSTASGGLYVDQYGDPGQDIEGQYVDGSAGGVLDIQSASSSLFTLSSLDFAAYDSSGAGNQTLTVAGYLGGTLVGTDTFTLANTADYSPTYSNWTLESASNLSGVSIDDLMITLNAGSNGSYFSEAIDNVTLNAVAGIPEPATWTLLLAGFAGLGAAARARRKQAVVS